MVDIEFSRKLKNRDEYSEMAMNIAQAITDKVYGTGVAPENNKGFVIASHVFPKKKGYGVSIDIV